MDLDAQQKVSPYLAAGERLLWAGRPGQGLILRGYDAFLIPFGLLWTGLTSIGLFKAPDTHSGNSAEMPVFFAVIVGILGFYFLFGRFLVDIWQRSKTYYGLTDQRAVIVSGIFFASVRSFNLKATEQIGFQLRSGGRGTISFGDLSVFGGGRRRSIPGMSSSPWPAFERIENAKEVYDMIQRAAREGKA